MERYNHLLTLRKHQSAHVVYSLLSGFVAAIIAIFCLSMAFNILNTQCTITDYETIEGYTWKEPFGPDGNWVLRSIYKLPTNITYHRYGDVWNGILIITSSFRGELVEYEEYVAVGTTLPCYNIDGDPYFHPGHKTIIYHVLGWISVVVCIISIGVTIAWSKSCIGVVRELNTYEMLPGNYV